MNLITQKPKFHRELLTLKDKVLEPKTTYTFQDLWNYLQISFIGKSHNIASAYMTDEELKEVKESVLAKVPEYSTTEKQYLLDSVSKYGLEVVLFAIDSLADSSDEDVPNVEDLRLHFYGAIKYVKYLNDLENS